MRHSITSKVTWGVFCSRHGEQEAKSMLENNEVRTDIKNDHVPTKHSSVKVRLVFELDHLPLCRTKASAANPDRILYFDEVEVSAT